MMKYQSMKEKEMMNEMAEKANRDERRRMAKIRPDLFEGSGDNLVPKIRRVPV